MLHQREQDIREKETLNRQMAGDLRQAQISQAELEEQSVELQQAFGFHETNRAALEKRLSQCWHSVQQLAYLVGFLRYRLDGPRLSDGERAIDVGAVILEREVLRLEVEKFKGLLGDCCARIRAKDQKIAELERL